jgi:hypothetical protein
MGIFSNNDKDLEQRGLAAIRDIEDADKRLAQAAADLRGGRIRERDYKKAEDAAKDARHESRDILSILGLR